MKNDFNLFVLITLGAAVCLGCSIFSDDFDQVRSVAQSGDFICIVKARLSAEYKVRSPLSKAELFIHGSSYRSEDFPNIVVRNCTAIDDKMMSLKADDGTYFALYDTGTFKLKKLQVNSGSLSNDFQWFVTPEKRINPLTGEEIIFKTKLPSGFLGNSPDWKTVVAWGKDDYEKDSLSLYLVDMETGIAKEKFLRRSNNLFLLDHSHQVAGIVSENLWMSEQFRWLPDASGKFQLVYPIFEPEETKK